MSVALQDEDFETVKRALKLADELCTIVIAGSPGAQAKALEYARAINDLKKRGIYITERQS